MPRTRLSSGPSPLEARYPQSTTHQHHGIQTGCILWLPKKDDIDERLLAGVDIEDGCFNHPIVVLSTNRAEGKATVLILTSFDGRDLAERYPENRHQRTHHLPISPSAPHPDNGILLLLDGNLQLRKKTYVKTEVKVILNTASLVPYCRSRKKYKLNQTSSNILAVYANSTLPTPTRHLYHPPPTTTTTSRHSVRTIPHPQPQTPSPPPPNPIIIPHTRHRPPFQIEPSIPPQRNTRTSPPPPPYSAPSPTPPPPDPLALAAFLLPLLLLGFWGAAAYRRRRLGKWASEGVKRKWGGLGGVLARRVLRVVGDGAGVLVWGLGLRLGKGGWGGGGWM